MRIVLELEDHGDTQSGRLIEPELLAPDVLFALLSFTQAQLEVAFAFERGRDSEPMRSLLEKQVGFGW